MRNHLVLPDTQHSKGCPTEHLTAAGNFIVEHKPEVVVHIGDHFDMPSINSHTSNTIHAENNRYVDDIAAGIEGIEALLAPLKAENSRRRANKKALYKPRLVFTLGNHEERIARLVSSSPELQGVLGYEDFMLESFGFEVHDFLKIVEIDGVNYTHYVKNLNSNYPIGRAHLIAQRRGQSFTVGHQPGLDFHINPFKQGDSRVMCLIAGSYYLHDEGYRGYQGNENWRGLIYKQDVKDGSYCPQFLTTDFMINNYL